MGIVEATIESIESGLEVVYVCRSTPLIDQIRYFK